MNQQRLDLKNLNELDSGVVNAAFDHEFQHIVRDCLDRPADKRKRKVTIEFEVIPVQPTEGRPDCEEIDVTAIVKSSVPKRQSKTYTMRPKHDGSVVFHPDIPEDPNADALFDPPAKFDPATGEVTE